MEAQLPDGVTLDTATTEQLEEALANVVSSGDEASINAAVATATAPGRANSISSTQAANVVVTATVSRSSNNIALAAANSTTSPEAELAGRVIARIITNGNLTAAQATRLFASVSSITVQSAGSAQEALSALTSIITEILTAAAASGIDLDDAETISDAISDAIDNTTCTISIVSNAGVACTTS